MLVITIPMNSLRLSSSMSMMNTNTKTTANTSLRQSRSRSRSSSMSASEARLSLLLALASQSSSLSLRVLSDVISETAKYVLPKRFDARSVEEAFMSVPDLETVNYKVISRKELYEIRLLEPYVVAVTTMPGRQGFDFYGASRSFNVLAEYLFGKNRDNEKMEMTTPVITRRTFSTGDRMEMTNPVITKRVEGQEKWEMSFVLPSKYGSTLPVPKDPAVRIKEVTGKQVAVSAFSGYVTDEEVKQRESRLRDALQNDKEYQIINGAEVEVLQYNPPFTPPFARRNEISLEVARRQN